MNSEGGSVGKGLFRSLVTGLLHFHVHSVTQEKFANYIKTGGRVEVSNIEKDKRYVLLNG
jgi:hypothetical protein